MNGPCRVRRRSYRILRCAKERSWHIQGLTRRCSRPRARLRFTLEMSAIVSVCCVPCTRGSRQLILSLVRCMTRAAVTVLACLLAACSSSDTAPVATLAPLFVCGRAIPTLDSSLVGDPGYAPPQPSPARVRRVPRPAYAEYAPLPPYPYEARLRFLEPTMLVQLRVTSKGTVRQATVLRSTAPAWLNRAVADTLRSWKLPPGTAQDVRIPIVYSLHCENERPNT